MITRLKGEAAWDGLNRRVFSSVQTPRLIWQPSYVMYLTNRVIVTSRFSTNVDGILTSTLTFAALADPTRRAILARLTLGETTVTKLAEPFQMSGPAISKHLKVLERAGLIARGREAQWRPCRLEAAPLKQASNWLERYRRFWEESFDRLDDYLHDLQKKEKKHGRRK